MITFEFTNGPLSGRKLVGGYPGEKPGHGAGVFFPFHVNAIQLKGITTGNVFARTETNPGLVTLIEEYERGKKAEKEKEEKEKQEEIRKILSGEVQIKPTYYDGEYLSGYMVHEPSASLLIKLGLAKEVAGWGTHLNGEVVTALGEKFSYAEAQELARPALEAKKAKQDAKNSKREAIFSEAKKTGKPQVLRSWMTDRCMNGNDGECSFDDATEYALPNGKTRVEYICCH